MRDTILIIAAFAGIMGLIGYMNHADIQTCMANGHSWETCNHAFNR